MYNPMSYMFYISMAFLLSCSHGSDDSIILNEPKEIIPVNLTLDIEVVGKDTNYPNGDGSGKIVCKASATHAVKYGFKIGNQTEAESSNGVFQYTFTSEGINEYQIAVFAYSSTGHSISSFQNVTVFVSNGELELVWSDEFNTDGVPDTSKWGYDIGNGCPNLCGWGNGEKQYYTSRPDNVKVENGLLKITAKKENYQGFSYTSARLLTKDKFEFTYGKVEVKAKLPIGQGTWPAIWMLGANIDEVGWPACGEIDIMEHWGHNPTFISSATHTPACSGGCENTKVGETTLSDYHSEFHVYGLEWTEDQLYFTIDGEIKYTYKPTTKNSSTWPYNAPQFIILNVAMGGNWFAIDENYIESTMEIDYIKVYQ